MEDDFNNTIQDCWAQSTQMADPIASLSYKLKVTKLIIKAWLLSHRENYLTRLSEIKGVVLSIDRQAESGPLSSVQ